MTKKKVPETYKVELTLEESGWLCYLMMNELIKHSVPSQQISFLQWLELIDQVKKRQERLWIKLAAANDTLMGKE